MVMGVVGKGEKKIGGEKRLKIISGRCWVGYLCR